MAVNFVQQEIDRRVRSDSEQYQVYLSMHHEESFGVLPKTFKELYGYEATLYPWGYEIKEVKDAE